MRKDEFAVCSESEALTSCGFVQFLLGFGSEMPSSPLPTNRHQPPHALHAPASPRRPRSRGWLLGQLPVGMWVPASSRNKAPEKSKCYKKMQNPVSKSLSHCSIKILHVIPFVCKVCHMQSLKGTGGPSAPEIFRDAPSVKTHPLSPLPRPPHATRKSTKVGEQGCVPFLTSFLIKIKEVYEIKFSGIALKLNGFWLSCTRLLDALNVQRVWWRGGSICVNVWGNVLNKNYFLNDTQVLY